MRIVVPITPRNLSEVQAMDLSRFDGVDIIEWRADFLKKEDILRVAPAIFEAFSGHELIFTLRTQNEGGHIGLEDEEYIRLIEEVSNLYRPNYIDFEYFSYKHLFDRMLNFSNLVLSYHNFNETPVNLMEILSDLTRLSPCVVKVAVMPEKVQDVLDLMDYTHRFKKLNPGQSYVTISMGELGKVSRIVGDLTGSCWTFASLGEVTEPGQIPFVQLKQIREILNEN